MEGDGRLGTISGGEVVSGITKSDGQISAGLTSAVVVGITGVLAKLLDNDGSGVRVIHHHRKAIDIGIMFTHLPLVRR